MSDDPKETDAWAGMSRAWRAEGAEGPAVDTADIARRARRFAWKIRLRNAREWFACLVMIVAGAVWAARDAAWPSRVSALGLIAVSIWVGGVLAVRGQNLPAPSPAATTEEVLAHERAQLERQRVLLLGVRRWYLAPLMAWMIMTQVIIYTRIRDLGAGAKLHSLVVAVVAIVLFVVVDRLNARAARELAKKLAQLG